MGKFSNDCDSEEDLSQDIWLHVLEKVRRGADPDFVDAWLTKVATRLCLDRCRVESKREELRRRWLADAPTWLSHRQMDVVVESRLSLVRLLSGLSDRQRNALVMRHGQGRSVAEVACAMGVAEGTVKATVYRAIQRIREDVGRRDAIR